MYNWRDGRAFGNLLFVNSGEEEVWLEAAKDVGWVTETEGAEVCGWGCGGVEEGQIEDSACLVVVRWGLYATWGWDGGVLTSNGTGCASYTSVCCAIRL